MDREARAAIAEGLADYAAERADAHDEAHDEALTAADLVLVDPVPIYGRDFDAEWFAEFGSIVAA